MPFTNFDSRHFSEAERTAVETALHDLERALVEKLANLSVEERLQYGSVNEQNKLIVNKVKDFRDSQPELSSPDVDWGEFEQDHQTRAYVQNTIQRLQSLIDGLTNAKILHDWDNYQASLSDYEFAKYKLHTNAIGYQTKVNELKQFFNRTGATTPSTPSPDAPENPS